MNSRTKRTTQFKSRMKLDFFQKIFCKIDYRFPTPKEQDDFYLSLLQNGSVHNYQPSNTYIEDEIPQNENTNQDVWNVWELEEILNKINFLNLEIINNWVEHKKEFKFFWKSISSNPEFDISWYEKYPNKPWDTRVWSYSDRFHIHWCLLYPELEWDWKQISSHKNLKLKWMLDYPELPWSWKLVASNHNVNLKWVDMLATKSNSSKIFKKLSYNVNLNLEWVKKYSIMPWNWEFISQHQNVTLEWLTYFQYQNWNWRTLSMSPNIEYEWYLKFPDATWDFNELLKNPSFFNSYREYQKKKYLATYKIQKWWKKILYNPNTKVGFAFVNKLYDDNFSNK